jgi:SET domain-containing protein
MGISVDERFEIREARPGTGLGLFARLPIKKGEFIIEYTGKKIPTATADESESRYLFEVDDIWTLDGPVPENTAGYINHDCYPNVEAEIEEGKIMIYALKDIAPGEEFTIDYDIEYFDEFLRPTGCKCASCEKGLISPHMKKKKKA